MNCNQTIKVEKDFKLKLEPKIFPALSQTIGDKGLLM